MSDTHGFVCAGCDFNDLTDEECAEIHAKHCVPAQQRVAAEQAVIAAARRLERAIASPPATYKRGDIKRSKAEIDAAIDDILSTVTALDALEKQK